MTDHCSAITDNGGSCQLPGSRDDGRCHHHTSIESQRATGGRPSIMDKHWDDILAGARQGMTLAGCARLAGVDESTLHRWKNSHEDFRKSLKRARAHGELTHLQTVNDPGSRFVLERSFGYVKTEHLDVDANVEQTTQHELRDEERTLALEAIRHLQQRRSETDKET